MHKSNSLNATLEELSKLEENQTCFDCSKIFIYSKILKKTI